MAFRARLLRALGLGAAFLAVSAPGAPNPATVSGARNSVTVHLIPGRPATTTEGSPELSALSPNYTDIAAFYADRGFRPLWVEGRALRAEAHRLLRVIEHEQGGLEPGLAAAVAAARSGEARALTRADLLVTGAYADFVVARQRPPAQRTIRYIDAGLAPEVAPVRAILEEAAAAPSLGAHLDRVERVNPALDGLRRGLEVYRARWSRLPQVAIRGAGAERERLLRRRLGLAPSANGAALGAALREFQRVHGLGVSGRADAATIAALNAGASHYERLILANIERARAIPARRGRSIIVDTATARLWMIEDGRIAGYMRVIVGKAAMPTPAMAGMIRYAVLNPYWQVPPDLIRERARKVVRRGPGVLAAERLQVLSDWSPRARTLAPRQVDWRAVAAGRRYVNLRQRPGPDNMMGRIKFMMPNDLGVYLHDTPLRHFFAREDRRVSSGCVRLEDAARLERWLFRGRVPRASGAAEQRVDLPEAVPVYIAYFTALPSRDGVRFFADLYGRDRGLMARMERRSRAS